MKKMLVLLIVMLAAHWMPAQETTANSWAPLLLYTNGSGSISNLRNGQMLKAGQRFYMLAGPQRGSVFAGWQQVKKAIEVKTVNYPSGVTVITTNTVISTTSKRNYGPWMAFVMEPVTVRKLDDNPGTSVVTEYHGWQANFAPAYKR